LCARSTAILFAVGAAEGRIAAGSLSDPTEIARDFAFSLLRRALSRRRSQAPDDHDTDRGAKNQCLLVLNRLNRAAARYDQSGRHSVPVPISAFNGFAAPFRDIVFVGSCSNWVTESAFTALNVRGVYGFWDR
jgi:hypothetical protein